ncbi:phage tail assembly chaperone [Exiguobacterium artemiae]
MNEQNRYDHEVDEAGTTQETVAGTSNEFVTLADLLDIDVTNRRAGSVKMMAIDGKWFDIPINALDADEESKIRKEATRKLAGPRGQITEELDDLKYNCLIVDKALDSRRTEMSFRSAALASKLGLPVAAPEMIIPKLFAMVSVADASREVIALSGLDEPDGALGK